MEFLPAKHILLRNKSTSWFGTDHTMNLYRGCSHGCIYCDSRSACYGDDRFDTVKAKEDALTILRDELRRKVRPGFVGMGSMSDPYNPMEKELEWTRKALMLLDAYQFGVAIATKSDLIVRDMDQLSLMKEHVPVVCKITITTTDDALAAKLEPHAPSPTRRLAAIEKLSRAGVFTGVLLMPVLPFLEDSEENVLSVVEGAARAGAKFVYPAFGMTQRDRQRDFYLQKLEELFPGQYLQTRHLKQFGDRYQCTSPAARRLWEVFSKRCRQLGLLYEMKHIVFHAKQGYGEQQLSFFD